MNELDKGKKQEAKQKQEYNEKIIYFFNNRKSDRNIFTKRNEIL